jgi:hypothetical protein
MEPTGGTMKRIGENTVVMALALALAVSAGAQEKASAPRDEEIADVLRMAMTPGEAQAKLEYMVGTFDVTIRTWVDPAEPPIESMATSVSTWVLGKRYVQQMLAGYVLGESWSGIGYAGFDNVSKKYVATYMDSGSTGMLWFTGTMSKTGDIATMTATTNDEVTGEPVPIEMRVSVAPTGDHVTELWLGDATGVMSKVMELQYTRR